MFFIRFGRFFGFFLSVDREGRFGFAVGEKELQRMLA
jgi:hypothetical protein